MPTAPVDGKGTVVYYEDTGTPGDPQDYLTIVILHGVLFHGAIFRRLVPHAEKYNLRIVRVNWRDYPNSTPYSSEEFDVILNGDQTAKSAFVKEQGQQLAQFLLHFAKTQSIPKASRQVDGTVKGGMAVLSWSMGNMWTISLLGNARWLPESTRELLEHYLRSVVLYDPAITSCCGMAPPPAIYNPLRDTQLPHAERGARFHTWVTGYNTRVEDLSRVTTEYLLTRSPLGEAATPKMTLMSGKEYAEVTDVRVLRSNIPIIRFPYQIFRDNFERALLDTGGVWPSVKVVTLWGNESVNDCVLAAKAIHDVNRDPVPEGETKTRRNIEIREIDGGNHFPHWDIPETVVGLLAKLA